MAIEADRQAITDLPMTSEMLQSLRESARLLSTHYSTQIEGNRLTEAQVKEVIEGGGRFPVASVMRLKCAITFGHRNSLKGK